jgi:hypothetical protein
MLRKLETKDMLETCQKLLLLLLFTHLDGNEVSYALRSRSLLGISYHLNSIRPLKPPQLVTDPVK